MCLGWIMNPWETLVWTHTLIVGLRIGKTVVRRPALEWSLEHLLEDKRFTSGLWSLEAASRLHHRMIPCTISGDELNIKGTNVVDRVRLESCIAR